jgi:hypothetical protein
MPRRVASSQSVLWYRCQTNNNFEATAMANGTSDTPAYQPERAHRDLDASIEAGRAACQAAILINGGAAIALLTYLAGKAGQPGAPGALVRAACIAFGCYAIGVFQGALSMWFAARAGALFGWAGLETLSLTERNQIKDTRTARMGGETSESRMVQRAFRSTGERSMEKSMVQSAF